MTVFLAMDDTFGGPIGIFKTEEAAEKAITFYFIFRNSLFCGEPDEWEITQYEVVLTYNTHMETFEYSIHEMEVQE